MIDIQLRILRILVPLLLLCQADAAVIVTYRGDAENTFLLIFGYTDTGFDINSDGIDDYRFIGDGSFTAGIQAYGSNRFLGVLSIQPDLGGDLVPIDAGSIIGLHNAIPPINWYRHTDNGGGSGFGLNTGANQLQFADTYIGVEFAASDGIHYGWIQYTGFSHPEKGLFTRYPGGFINSWAYESQPGVSIIAGAIPEIGAPGLLCVNALLGLSRRQRKAHLETNKHE